MTDTMPPSPAREARSPFESSPRTALEAVRHWLAMSAVVGAAVAAAWWFTRAGGAEAASALSATAAAPAGGPVMLTPESEKRIGVTYAVVARGSLVADVRTVGIVAFDETRVKTIAPKIDGYVEQLFVAFTGQRVEVNDPLLRIYSPTLVAAQEELLYREEILVLSYAVSLLLTFAAYEVTLVVFEYALVIYLIAGIIAIGLGAWLARIRI